LREAEATLERKQREEEREAEIAELKFRSDLAWERFKGAMARYRLNRQQKANFNREQLRIPKGNGIESGRWAAGPGIGHNSDKFPEIPKQAPPTSKQRTAIAKQVARWLARGAAVVASRTPFGLATITAATGAVWLYNQYNAHIEAYRDPPKTLEELQQAALSPRPGYDVHHNAERASALEDGIPRSQVESPENRLLIPRMKHWEITGWYNTRAERFGGLSPRDYLRGKSWEERQKLGFEALEKFGVLKR
jgi:hypothetical protein